MNGPVVAIGFILLIPSILGMLFGVLMLFATGVASSQTFTFVIIMSFVGCLLGWLLIMRKRVLQCALCDAVVQLRNE